MQYKLPFLVEPPLGKVEPLSPLQRPAGRERYIILGGGIITYYLRRSARRTIGLTIDERGLQAAAPHWVSIAEIEAFIREKEAWILKHLRGRRARRPQFAWQPGARLPYLGREVILHCAQRDGEPEAQLHGERLHVRLAVPSQTQVLRDTVLSWLKREALTLYRQRIATLAPRFEVAAPGVALSHARTQWGSCTRKRDGTARILLNWKLVHFELPLIDYVAAHELAHLHHMNHSAAFWQAVARVYPDYPAARRALRERGHLRPEL
jgi:predicted metal-dependent hydrolase